MRPNLVIEPHPSSYEGEPFLTLVKFLDSHHLCIINNMDKRILSAYVLDFCSPHGIDPFEVMAHARDWFESPDNYHMPFSFYLSKIGYEGAHAIYHEFQLNHIARIVGPIAEYELREVSKIRKRTRRRA